MNYYSQAGQDRFVHALLIDGLGIKQGTFLDIGCAGLEWSNSRMLEELGWTGWLIDCQQQAERRNPFICGDATRIDYSFLPQEADYLSLDVDDCSLKALEQVLKSGTKFKVITIEHDAWRFGDTQRMPMREILRKAGYDLVCADVSCEDGFPFEDWHVSPELSKLAERFRAEGKHWKNII